MNRLGKFLSPCVKSHLLIFAMVSLILFLFPIISFSQGNTSYHGIKFEKGLSWPQVLKKAKAENKYIFVDCFATWCVPCKQMDENIYPLKAVGDYYNVNFISVKLQMDKTPDDDSAVKITYPAANNFKRAYLISSFPTFLFFNPEGQAVHKVAATKSADGFIELGRDALDSNKQYFTILKNYQPGQLDTAELKAFAKTFSYSDKKLAGRMAVEYLGHLSQKEMILPENLSFISTFKFDSGVIGITNTLIDKLKKKSLSEKGYRDLLVLFKTSPAVQKLAASYINALKEKDICTPDNIRFISNFTITTADKGFTMFYNNREMIDASMQQKGYAQQMVDFIIYNNEIAPQLIAATKSGTEPDFAKLQMAIEKKYTKKDAERNVINGKVKWFKYLVDKDKKVGTYWPQYMDVLVEQIEKYPPDTTFWGDISLNNIVWNAIFLHSTNPDYINKGIKWLEGIVRRNPTDGGYIDTYANLLYKSGQKDKAIEWEETACKASPVNKSYPKVLAKMKEGKPTWLPEE